MKCLGTLLFKEQAQTLMQLITEALSLIFALWRLPKKELTQMLIHVHKTINCKVTLSLSMCLVIVEKELWT